MLLLSGSVIVASLQQIFHKEGLRGMYRGLAPTVLALLPNWAVSPCSPYQCSVCNFACIMFLISIRLIESQQSYYIPV